METINEDDKILKEEDIDQRIFEIFRDQFTFQIKDLDPEIEKLVDAQIFGI